MWRIVLGVLFVFAIMQLIVGGYDVGQSKMNLTQASGGTSNEQISSNDSDLRSGMDGVRPVSRHDMPLLELPDDFPEDAFRPLFCTQMVEQRDGSSGAVSLMGEMDLSPRAAGNKVNAYMVGSSWTPHDMIKQVDAAALFYISNGISLSYTFVANDKSPNTCIINWRPLNNN